VANGYLLDTNVVSETRRNRPDPGITDFLSTADSAALFLSVLTLGELRKGIQTRRRSDPLSAERLEFWVNGIETLFADRILSIESEIAKKWGELSAGRTLPVIDTLIAATAIVGGLTLVTRNTRDVEATGVALLDPWRGKQLTARRGE
jgi:hypothetical protein